MKLIHHLITIEIKFQVNLILLDGPLVFMDSHIEVTDGWLEPLLARLAENRNTTAISVMDTIDMDTLEFRYIQNPEHTPITGFDWNMIFKWIKVPGEAVKNLMQINLCRIGFLFQIRLRD